VPALILDIDGDGEFEGLTDALLNMRRCLDYTGDALTAGAVDTDCSRCEAPQILGYLNALGDVFDIDDDGEIESMTDALLVMRWRFGFRGVDLVSDAVDSDCERCSPAQIELYLDSLD
jgi:hypothetical protein